MFCGADEGPFLLSPLTASAVVRVVRVSPRQSWSYYCVPYLSCSIQRYKDFKDFKKRILVCTDLFGRGIDIERVNIVINYDFPESKEGGQSSSASDQYLHRVGRAGRFGTKGLAISFISSATDSEELGRVQSRFEVNISELPDQIDISSYMS